MPLGRPWGAFGEVSGESLGASGAPPGVMHPGVVYFKTFNNSIKKLFRNVLSIRIIFFYEFVKYISGYYVSCNRFLSAWYDMSLRFLLHVSKSFFWEVCWEAPYELRGLIFTLRG